jgi:hypothetical protein
MHSRTVRKRGEYRESTVYNTMPWSSSSSDRGGDGGGGGGGVPPPPRAYTQAGAAQVPCTLMLLLRALYPALPVISCW